MLKYARILFAATILLALAALFLAPVARGRDDEDKEEKENLMKTAAAQVDVLKLVANLGGKEDDVKKQAQDVSKKHDIKYVMNQFKPRDKGGVGVGPKPGTAAQDSIELELLTLGKKPLPAGTLTAQQADLQKMAETAEAIALIAPAYATNEGRKGQEVKDWNRYCEDMLKQSKDLDDALKSGDPKRVQTAAGTLNASCNVCHTAFRDKDN